MPKLTKLQQSSIGKRSRRKGKGFERYCATIFTKWFYGDWRTTRNSGRTDLKGDIYCLQTPDMPLVVECKHDKRYTLRAMARPTDAFKELVRKYRRRQVQLGWGWTLLLIIKNQAGTWVAMISNTKNLNSVLRRGDCLAITTNGMQFFKIDQALEGIHRCIASMCSTEQKADARPRSKGMDKSSKKGKNRK